MNIFDSESIERSQKDISISFSFEGKIEDLDPKFFELAGMDLPDHCPRCNFTHDTHLWVRRNDNMTCDSCGYVPTQSDKWPRIIGD